MKDIKIGTIIEVKATYVEIIKIALLECIAIDKERKEYTFKNLSESRRCPILADEEWFESKNREWKIISGGEKMNMKEALETLRNKRFSVSYKVNSYFWELTLYKDDNEILDEYVSTEFKYLIEKYLNQKIEYKSSNELMYLESLYTTENEDGLDVYLEYDGEEHKGYMKLETGYSEKEIEFKNFDDFVKTIVDMENIIDDFISDDIDIRNEYKRVI